MLCSQHKGAGLCTLGVLLHVPASMRSHIVGQRAQISNQLPVETRLVTFPACCTQPSRRVGISDRLSSVDSMVLLWYFGRLGTCKSPGLKTWGEDCGLSRISQTLQNKCSKLPLTAPPQGSCSTHQVTHIQDASLMGHGTQFQNIGRNCGSMR